jgi:hypothetical protein
MKNRPITGTLAVVAAMLMSAAAHAQITINNGGRGEVILNFTQTSGTANLEVDLGSIKQFLAGGSFATGAPVTLTLLSTADLVAAYGASWNSSADNVFWSVATAIGTLNNAGAPKLTLFGTVANNASIPTGDNNQGAEGAFITDEISNLTNYNPTANSTEAGLVPVSDSSSYNGDSGLTGNGGANPSQGFFSVPAFGANFQDQTNGTSSSDFYEMQENTAGTDIGTFTLSSSGLTFQSAAAVPEPSTWATVILGAATLIGLRRRRA